MVKHLATNHHRNWDWVGSEVQSASQIKLSHRRRAAGLTGKQPCPQHLNPPSNEDGSGRENGTTPKSKGKIKNVCKCKPKTCKANYRCHNLLGAEELLDPNTVAEYIREGLGDVPEERDGPAGLRNLGATCYANAFLQLWFHNVAFRNGVYACVTSETTPLFQLALVFGMLECSERKVVDPMGLIEALRLNTGDQQDAAEFSKLFMSIIASEFAKHPRPEIKSLVKDQFEGTMQYITQCECGYQSVTETSFFELELSLKDNTTLQSRLDTFMDPEVLDGDNRYNCPSCEKKQIATRKQVPKDMPSVIHFSLLRFVFDSVSMSRKKSKASIRYPKEIRLGGAVYELRGVITHMGTSAHHGHFICETYDESDDIWYICNDEEITKKPERPRKRVKLDKVVASTSSDDKEESSKDAYMLVYKKRDVHIRPVKAPQIVADRVKADNLAFQAELGKLGVKKKVLKDEWEHVTGAKLDVVKALPGTDYIVPRDALSQWIKSKTFDDLYTPFDYSPLLCTHDQIDLSKSPDTRTISWLSHDKLSQYFPLPEVDICATCVEDGFKSRITSAERQSAIETFDELNGEHDEKEAWCLSKTWLAQWRAGKLPSGATPNSDDHTLFCSHGQRDPKSAAWIPITSPAISLLRSVFGNFPAFHPDDKACSTCSGGAAADADTEAQWKQDIKFDRSIKKHLDPIPPAFGIDYYLLPDKFAADWEMYMKVPGEKPNLETESCEHGLLDWDPQNEKRRVISETGWHMICQKYGGKEPIKVQFGSNPPVGKRINIVKHEPEVCEPCRISRLSLYDNVLIPIVICPTSETVSLLSPAPKIISTGRTSSRALRSRLRTISIPATRSTSIKDLKVEILFQTGITPLLQKIFYDDRELESNETIGAIDYLQGDEMRLVKVEEVGNVDDYDNADGGGGKTGRGNEGFGGTGLLARIACPDCTYENDGTAACCDMCGRPFAVEQFVM